jgi:hypothetical protein
MIKQANVRMQFSNAIAVGLRRIPVCVGLPWLCKAWCNLSTLGHPAATRYSDDSGIMLGAFMPE